VARDADPFDVTDATTVNLVAWTAPEPCAADFAQRRLRFPIRLLGRGIRVDAEHPVEVTVMAPESVDADAIAGLSVVQSGRVLAAGATTVAVTLTDREAPLELEVALTASGAAQAQARLAATGAPFLRERPEPRQPDLFRLRLPHATSATGSYR